MLRTESFGSLKAKDQDAVDAAVGKALTQFHLLTAAAGEEYAKPPVVSVQPHLLDDSVIDIVIRAVVKTKEKGDVTRKAVKRRRVVDPRLT